MDPTRYRAPGAGRIITTHTGYSAFIPAPMPPAIQYDAAIVLQLSRADVAVSELSGLGRHLPNPHLLIAPYIRREAVLSSRIEGTRASLSDLLLHEADMSNGSGSPDVREVQNYVLALEHGIRRLSNLPLSLRLVRELHSHLMEGVRGDSGTPGEFRRSQNWIGRPGSTLSSADYVPPPPSELMGCLGDWEHFVQERELMPDLVQCAVMHEQFEAIHPFLDGNGRVGRLLITLFLVERGRLSAPLLYLSAYIESHRDRYYDALQRVRTDGDWYGWIAYFLAGVTETAREAIQQARKLMDLRETLRLRLRGKAKALALVDELFVNPYVTVARAASLLGISYPTARQAVLLLQENAILEEVTGREWGRLYVAGPVLEALGG